MGRPFSAAPNTKPIAELIPDVEKTKSKLKLLWISCGNKDGLIGISQNVHRFLKKNDIEHVWHVDGHGHDPAHWSSSLYWFSQSVFQDKKPVAKQAPAPTPSDVTAVDDWKPSSINQKGKEYPQVNSERRARFRIVAPEAQSVSVSLGKVALTKGEVKVASGLASLPRWMKAFITTASRSTALMCRIQTASISLALCVGGAASKCLRLIRSSMR